MSDDQERPYTLYRSGGEGDDKGDDKPAKGDRPYTVYRSRRRNLLAFLRGDKDELATDQELGSLREERKQRSRVRGPSSWTVKRVLKFAAIGAAAWIGLSALLFMVSAQVEQEHVSEAAEKALDSSGPILASSSTILVLGSDARTKKTNDTGRPLEGQGTGRSDSIMLMRVGPGKAARLSIPRDTFVDIRGIGRTKINAAYASGGTALAITTVKDFLDIDVNHVLEVNFDNFPELIDSMGGINVETGCVRDKISGGDENGGVTVDLKPGENHLDGRHALAYARVRKNACDPSEDDRDRAKRQQEMLSAMKRRALSVSTFVRLPWVSWNAPKAIRSDMSGPSLMSLFAVMSMTGSPAPRVLQGALSGGGIEVSDAEKQAEVKRFLKG